MQIRVGFELTYECVQATPMLLMLHTHPSRAGDLLTTEHLRSDPFVPIRDYIDGFGNRCSRLVAPPGRITLVNDVVVNDSGLPDEVAPEARQDAVPDLPDDTLVFLLGSRYCETDRLNDVAWSLFGATPEGWPRVQAISDFAHRQIAFGYHHASPSKTAWDAYGERQGVCRDFAHLAVTLCRCMNIPARYCTGYLGDFGVPPDPAPMDFSAWFEAWLGGRWYTFDARHNRPRIGRVLMARGRDASDVALSTSFGPNLLVGFKVWSDEVTA
ncbi:MAG TPA: transglutaminase family protein [Geminicoccaceae bacterium]|nr:transglutaminase family protein [Geminicoccaceae bacterium]